MNHNKIEPGIGGVNRVCLFGKLPHSIVTFLQCFDLLVCEVQLV